MASRPAPAVAAPAMAVFFRNERRLTGVLMRDSTSVSAEVGWEGWGVVSGFMSCHFLYFCNFGGISSHLDGV